MNHGEYHSFIASSFGIRIAILIQLRFFRYRPLEVIGHDGKAHNVTMVPGDLVRLKFHCRTFVAFENCLGSLNAFTGTLRITFNHSWASLPIERYVC